MDSVQCNSPDSDLEGELVLSVSIYPFPSIRLGLTSVWTCPPFSNLSIAISYGSGEFGT